MKKLLLIITTVLIFNPGSINGQITLDTVINNTLGIGYGFKLVQISEDETKWYFADTSTNTFSLYNMDFTPFITNVAVPEPFLFSNGRMQVLYITRTLFNCDSSNIEYAYYSAANVGKPFRIMGIDGTLLFQLDSANGPFLYGATLGGSDVIRPIVNTSAGAKLFLQKYPLLNTFYVYSLCGTLPVDVFDFADFDQGIVKIYPNPSSGLLTFQINPPDNINEYELVIFDANAKEVRRETVGFWNSRFTIDVRNFSSGSYFYSLQTKNKPYQSGKFYLNK
ncbi:MAG: hypothetical protein KatS3mg031_3105 [Chitinophagales bacterium]|nr:MAG: hypothetical protein KatS3mg031_3105 [Chitinophagales bacterium]